MGRVWALALGLSGLATAAGAGPLGGKSYIIELTSSQYGSGYGEYLVPPLAQALDRAGLRSAGGPGADLVVNIRTDQDVGQWMGEGEAREWIHTVKITVGISPAAYVIPDDGTPQFGVTARLLTPNPDREDELECLIKLATRTAVANYKAKGHLKTDGQSCLRK